VFGVVNEDLGSCLQDVVERMRGIGQSTHNKLFNIRGCVFWSEKRPPPLEKRHY
jgi:hypothetical protein